MFRRSIGVWGATGLLVLAGIPAAAVAATAGGTSGARAGTPARADRTAPRLSVAQQNAGRISGRGAPRLVAPNTAVGTLTRGVPKTISIGTAGQDVQYSFAGTAGEHVTFDVSATNWGSGTARLHVFKPGGVWVTYFVLGNSPTFGDLDLDVSGTWNVVLDPQGDATGSATVTLAGDTGGTTLTRGTAVTASTNYRGQQARYAFSAQGGQHVTFDVSASNWGGNTARLYVFGPGGRYVTFFTLASAPTYGDLDIDENGTWKVVIDPQGQATGSTTFTLAGDVDGGMLQPGVAKTFAITHHGQRGRFTFAAVKNAKLKFSFSGATWTAYTGTGSAALSLFRSSGSYVTQFPLGSQPSSQTLTPDTTSTWIGLIDPAFSATGTVTVTITNA